MHRIFGTPGEADGRGCSVGEVDRVPPPLDMLAAHTVVGGGVVASASPQLRQLCQLSGRGATGDPVAQPRPTALPTAPSLRRRRACTITGAAGCAALVKVIPSEPSHRQAPAHVEPITFEQADDRSDQKRHA